jgi:hypothetical protein
LLPDQTIYGFDVMLKIPAPHPLFKIVPGKVRDWEKMR